MAELERVAADARHQPLSVRRRRSVDCGTGHTVFDLWIARQLRRGVELKLSLENLTSRDYYETQNYFESRATPWAPVVARIHATPAYPLTAVVGMTIRFGGK